MKKRLFVLLALLPLLAAGGGQYTIPGTTGAVAIPAVVLPVYSQSTGCNWATSCTLTVVAGDLVNVFCGSVFASNITSIVVTSTPSAVWNQRPIIGGQSGSSWAVMSTTGSTTFNCSYTPGANSYPAIIVYDYTGGTGATVQTSASATGNTSSSFSTTTPTLTIVCAFNSDGGYFALGTVGGNTATHLHLQDSWLACEDYSSNTPMTGAVSTIVHSAVTSLQSTSFQ